MATQLDTPITRADLIRQAVTDWGIRLQFRSDGTVDEGESFFIYFVTSFDSNGEKVGQKQTRRIPAEDLPAGIRNDIKAVHQKVISDAKSQGLIAPGTDSEDL